MAGCTLERLSSQKNELGIRNLQAALIFSRGPATRLQGEDLHFLKGDPGGLGLKLSKGDPNQPGNLPFGRLSYSLNS